MTTSRRFLMTAASKGIGLATAETLAARGHEVVGIARKPPESAFPGRFESCDLADPDATEAVLQKLTAEMRFDGVVNNVGLVEPAPLGKVDPASLQRVLDLNLRPALTATQALLPGMRDKGWGRIVNVASVAALGVPSRTSYGAAKAALISFTRTWALELARDGVTVNAVAPGPTETALFRAGNPPGSESEGHYLAAIPMGRLGRPSEIAGAIAYLLSDEAGFMTGQTLYVDGGMSVGRAPA